MKKRYSSELDRFCATRVDIGSDRSWRVTVTYRYGPGDFLTIPGANRAECDRKALARRGVWDSISSVSTPRSVYLDLIGETQRRAERLGMNGDHSRGTKEGVRPYDAA